MTVVCYDGELIAADRKSRIKVEDGSKKIKSLKKEKIIVDFKDTVFDGEKVFAAGRCGTLKVSKALIDILRRSKDLAETIDSLDEKLRHRFEESRMSAASIMIMTTHHIHVVKVSKKYEVRWQKEPRSKKMAIGSGSVIALFLMEHLGHSAPDAVVAMELNHECCGGGATYTSRIQTQLSKPLLVMKHKDRPALKRHLLKSTVRAALDQINALPPP